MTDDVNSSAKTQAIKLDNEDTEMVRREINSPDEKLNAVEPIVAPGNFHSSSFIFFVSYHFFFLLFSQPIIIISSSLNHLFLNRYYI